MARLFFLAPFISIIFAVVMPLGIKCAQYLPKAVNISIGALHTEDIRVLNKSQQHRLSERVFLHCLLAALCTALIGGLFVANGYGDMERMGISFVLCLVIQLIVGGVLVFPLMKITKSLKAELGTTAQ